MTTGDFVRKPGNQWLAGLLFLSLTLGPWVLLVWLVWSRR